MPNLRRHLKSLTIALATLTLSAGLVAGRDMPDAADGGLATAGEATGKTVPVGAPAPAAQPPAAEENAEAEAEETAGERPENHGWFVSQAANGETPSEFRNHGEYVSSIARGDAGKPDTGKLDAGKPEAAAPGLEEDAAVPDRTKPTAAKSKGGPH
jgi:hypothetical protein